MFKLLSVVEQVGLSPTQFETLKTDFVVMRPIWVLAQSNLLEFYDQVRPGVRNSGSSTHTLCI